MSNYTSIRQRLLQAMSVDATVKDNILSQIKGSQFWIKFNRPKRYNAFSKDMYYTFTSLIQYANQNPAIKFIIVTGNGGNYSSGNDLTNFSSSHYNVGTPQQMAKSGADFLQDLCNAIIKSEKPIFGMVQGKAIGFAFTQLALFDRVFAVKGAEFYAPLVKLAQGPQMCASYLFPRIFGSNVANDLIIGGKKVDAQFLQKYSFLESCESREQALKRLQSHLSELEQLEWNSYVTARKLMRLQNAQNLVKANERQCSNLVERWNHPDLPNHLIQYMSKAKARSKL